MKVISNEQWTIALGSAIGRAIGNNGAELKTAQQAAQTKPVPLPAIGSKVSWRIYRDKQTGEVVGYAKGYVLGREVTKLVVHWHNGNHMAHREITVDEVLEVVG
jgi:hypothetical protein